MVGRVEAAEHASSGVPAERRVPAGQRLDGIGPVAVRLGGAARAQQAQGHDQERPRGLDGRRDQALGGDDLQPAAASSPQRNRASASEGVEHPVAPLTLPCR